MCRVAGVGLVGHYRAGMLVGAHVRGGGSLADTVERGREIGAGAIQVFTQSPRMWRPSRHTPDAIARFRDVMAGQDEIQAVFCHATYLVNLATSDPALLARSVECLVDNFRIATAMGAQGLVVHVGSHRGGGFEGCLDQVVTALAEVLRAVPPPDDGAVCPILLENAAGAGGTVGRDFTELACILERVVDPWGPGPGGAGGGVARAGGGPGGAGGAGGAGTGAGRAGTAVGGVRGASGGAGGRAGEGDRLGVCLDTQHLWASGIDFASVEAADQVVDRIDEVVGLHRLRCLHLNDSAVAFGANRDRHANLGSGTIGDAGLAALLGHPKLQGMAAVLEVPGDGSGPTAAEVARAKALVVRGVGDRNERRSGVR